MQMFDKWKEKQMALLLERKINKKYFWLIFILWQNISFLIEAAYSRITRPPYTGQKGTLHGLWL